MNVKQLKDSILQYAMQGKLVSQNPRDEPSSELLNRIAEEKQGLIKEGIIKKEKSLEPITENEIPFDIPDSWEWVQLIKLAEINGGFAFKSTNYSPQGVRVIRISDFNEQGFINDKIVRHTFDESLSNYLIKKDNILLCMTGGTVGKSYFVKEILEPMMTNQRVATIKIDSRISAEYVNYVILSPLIQNIIKVTKNSTNDNISMDLIKKFPIPLPPFEEQKRIVSKIEELMICAEKYEEAHNKVEFLNYKFPLRLENSILQHAMQGKLVEQDPSEEPTKLLIDKIQLEKERLIKEKLIKKEKLLPPIMEEELPIEIPDSWEWVRLGEISKVIEYGTSQKTSDYEQQVPVLRMNNIVRGEISYNNLKYVSNDIKDLPRLYLKHQDILFNRTNSFELVGKSACYKGEDDKFSFASYLIRVELFKELVSPIYVNYYLNSYLCRKTQIEPHIIQQNGQANFNGTKLKNIIIPLPPLEEQRRIVQTIGEYLAIKNKIMALQTSIL